MDLLNTIGIAGLVFSLVFMWIVGRASDKREVFVSALLALIPAVFAALASL